jgi:hypothetical protein
MNQRFPDNLFTLDTSIVHPQILTHDYEQPVYPVVIEIRAKEGHQGPIGQ